MQTMKIKPKKGLTVRDPITRNPLAAKGEDKPQNTYWMRRVKDKSVERMTTGGAEK
ncbi:DUF2635 domain-containing protein [Vibrio sp. OPT18]|uniref:DUF2635 domain-containing protein n=1 Tax=Vibrio sp. OPT18 TaxID=2778641 RepID=UPI00187EF7B2|nr:DUF2635 domain-containing protein [Vibrio sp. OPT18]MBE8574459.1 DUF2635 domain-containing protein [Vibrio sp. OPT18]